MKGFSDEGTGVLGASLGDGDYPHSAGVFGVSYGAGSGVVGAVGIPAGPPPIFEEEQAGLIGIGKMGKTGALGISDSRYALCLVCDQLLRWQIQDTQMQTSLKCNLHYGVIPQRLRST